MLYGDRQEGDSSPLETQADALLFLSACAVIALTFMSFDIHEWMVDQDDLAAITATSVTLFDNSWIERDGLAISGLIADIFANYRRFKETQSTELRYPHRGNIAGIDGTVHDKNHKLETEWLEGYCSIPGYHFLHSYHPEYWLLIKGKKIELVLSGHAL